MNRFIRGALAVFLGLSLMLPLGSFGWASESDELAPNETLPDETMVLDEGDALFVAPLLLDEPVLEEGALGDELIEDAESDVEVTLGWNAFGTCEWQIDDAGCLTIRPAGNGANGLLPDIKSRDGFSDAPWLGEGRSAPSATEPTAMAKSIKKARIAGAVKASNSLYGMFEGCINLTDIDGLNNLDTSAVESMARLFSDCISLIEVDLSSFDTSNVKNMGGMFSVDLYEYGRRYPKFKTLDLSSFDTSKVTNMRDMFRGCKQLEVLDISSFDTSNVVGMEGMFTDCESLVELDLRHFDTSKVTSFGGFDYAWFGSKGMFSGCTSLETLDLSNFNTTKSDNFGYMFLHCSSLKKLDLSGFDTSKAMAFSYMFMGCSALKELNLMNFDTSKVSYFGAMFSG